MPSSSTRPSWPTLSTSPLRVSAEPPLKRTWQSTRSPGFRPVPSDAPLLPVRRSAKTLPPADITSRAPTRTTTVPRTCEPRALPSLRTAAAEYVPSGSFAPRTITVLPTRKRLNFACRRTVRTVPSLDAVTSALRAASLATTAPRNVAAPAVAGSTTASAAIDATRSSRYRFIRCLLYTAEATGGRPRPARRFVSFGGGRAATALLLECSIGEADALLARNHSREPPQSRDRRR